MILCVIKGVKSLRWLPACLLLLLVLALAYGAYRQGAGRAVAPAERIVILIGLDGFRADYLKKYQPPTLSRLAREGVTAEKMISSFPTQTFPNLYTLATGLRPENHGVIANSMFDPQLKERFALGTPAVVDGRWRGGEPVWLTAQRQGIRAACMFWPGSEAEIQGQRPHEWRLFDKNFSPRDRVNTVLNWLELPEAERPGMITLYFHEADSAGHRYGPDSVELRQAIGQIDQSINELLQGIKKARLGDRVNLIFVSDHGMAALDPQKTIVLGDLIDGEKVAVDFSGPIVGLRPIEGKSAETARQMVERLRAEGKNKHFLAYLREEMPERLHFRKHDRIPPVMLLAEEGWFFIRRPLLTEAQRAGFAKGNHGFDPELPSMAAAFIAYGPAFRSGVVLPPFENVEIYSLVCETLGIKPALHDGRGVLAGQVLKP